MEILRPDLGCAAEDWLIARPSRLPGVIYWRRKVNALEPKRGNGSWALAGFGALTLLALYTGAHYATVQRFSVWGSMLPRIPACP